MISLTDDQRDAITELLNIGMGRAADALSQMVKEEVYLSVPFLELLSRCEAALLIGTQVADRITAIKQQFSGVFWGDTLLLFPEHKSLELVRALLQEAYPLEDMTEMEEEAFMEVGNIIINACVGSIADLLNSEISNSLPIFLQGPCEEIVGLRSISAPDEDSVLFLRMDFILRKRSINGYVIMIMESESVNILKDSINALLDNL